MRSGTYGQKLRQSFDNAQQRGHEIVVQVSSDECSDLCAKSGVGLI
jgi:hypothetical protein